MSKYINADKFIIPKGTVDDIAKRGVIAIHDLLEIQPTADVVEAVRCKDCKYARPDPLTMTAGRETVYICAAKTNPNYCWADDYCSCGERKEAERNT